jgi:hypothetical protein
MHFPSLRGVLTRSELAVIERAIRALRTRCCSVQDLDAEISLVENLIQKVQDEFTREILLQYLVLLKCRKLCSKCLD